MRCGPLAPATLRIAVAAVVALLLAACGSTSAGASDAAAPRDGRAGLQLTGSIAGRQLVVSDASPRLVVGDCDPDPVGDTDVCAIAQDITGELFVLVIENPGALEAGASLPIADVDCAGGCDDVRDVAVVDVQIGTGGRTRAVGGRLDVTRLRPSLRYAGSVRVVLPSGSASGSFDLVPREDD